MPKRDSVTEKWDDKWYLRLSPLAKNLWEYIRDKCDCAGFWEIDLSWAAKAIKTTEPRLQSALTEIAPKIIQHNGWLWIRKFIFHQGNYPLNPENNCHKGILNRFALHSDFGVSFEEEVVKLGKIEAPKQPPIRGYGKGKGKGKGNGKGKYADEFLVFWNKYPERWIKSSDTKVKVGKDLAAEQWDKLSQSEQQYILRVVGRLRVGESVPDAWRWLRDRKWKDYELPKPKPVPLPKEQAKASVRSKEIKNFVPGQSPFAQYKEMPLDKLIEKYKTSNEFERRIIKECRPEIKDRISPQKDIQNEAQQQIKKLGAKP